MFSPLNTNAPNISSSAGDAEFLLITISGPLSAIINVSFRTLIPVLTKLPDDPFTSMFKIYPLVCDILPVLMLLL